MPHRQNWASGHWLNPDPTSKVHKSTYMHAYVRTTSTQITFSYCSTKAPTAFPRLEMEASDEILSVFTMLKIFEGAEFRVAEPTVFRWDFFGTGSSSAESSSESSNRVSFFWVDETRGLPFAALVLAPSLFLAVAEIRGLPFAALFLAPSLCLAPFWMKGGERSDHVKTCEKWTRTSRWKEAQMIHSDRNNTLVRDFGTGSSKSSSSLHNRKYQS